MTLIMAVATQHYVVLLSDRRITVRDTRTREPKSQEDTDTKSTILNNRYVMGFAGLGRFGPNAQRLEAWVSDQLSAVQPEDYFETLAARIAEACEQHRHTSPHSFLAVGYGNVADGVASDPEIVVVSNAFDTEGNVLKSTMYPWNFEVRHFPLIDRFMFKDVGSTDIPQHSATRVHRTLVRETRRAPDQPYNIIGDLVSALRETAHLSRGTIGTSGIVTSIPRTAVPIEVVNVRLAISVEDFRSFDISLTIPDEDHPNDTRTFQPAFIDSRFHSVMGRGDVGFKWLGPEGGLRY